MTLVQRRDKSLISLQFRVILTVRANALKSGCSRHGQARTISPTLVFLFDAQSLSFGRETMPNTVRKQALYSYPRRHKVKL